MGIISTIRRWIGMVFGSRAEELWQIKDVTSPQMEGMIDVWEKIYKGYPYWLNSEEHIKTINFAKSICVETARLTTLGIKIQVDGSTRANWLQEQIESMYFKLREWVEKGCAYGTIILKPNGTDVDLITPQDFIVTEVDNGNIRGIVFFDTARNGKKWYTRLEYHRFENSQYVITNKCYVGDTEGEFDKMVDISETPWAVLYEETYSQNIEQPLFAMLRTPSANSIDDRTPLGMAVYADAIEELKDLDVAYSRNAKEIYDSKRTVLMDSDRLLMTPAQRKNLSYDGVKERIKSNMGLPDMVKIVEAGGNQNDYYQEINPTLNTMVRVEGINNLLSQIGYKCGFSNGYFVFDQNTGIATATQIEADQQRTIQFIKDMRDKLEDAIDQLLYALNAFADLYDLAPVGTYEAVYDFGDITYNREEDRARWYSYVASGQIPMWYYLTKFEGMTEEEAKELLIAQEEPAWGDEE